MVISARSSPSLTPSPDVLLSAPRAGMPDSFRTLTGADGDLQSVILALAARRGPEALATWTVWVS